MNDLTFLQNIWEAMETEETSTCLLKISPPNAKIEHYSFSLPSGFTCPFASSCLSKADRVTGKIKDSPTTDFRCFAASAEGVFPALRKQRWSNFDALREIGLTNTDRMAEVIKNTLMENLPRSSRYFRVHIGGDFFNEYYFEAWKRVAEQMPGLNIYAYTKSVPYVVKNLPLPENFIITASKGGIYDDLIEKHKLKFAQVVFSEEEAANYVWFDKDGEEHKGLEIDHDDSHAYKDNKPFALLLHGIQPAGSVASIALKALGGLGGKSSYSKKMKKERNKDGWTKKESIQKFKNFFLNEEEQKKQKIKPTRLPPVQVQNINMPFGGNDDAELKVYFRYWPGTRLSPGHPYANRDTSYEADDPPEIDIGKVVLVDTGEDITNKVDHDMVSDRIDTRILD